MKKRIISTLCAGTIVTALLTGCGGVGQDLPHERSVELAEPIENVVLPVEEVTVEVVKDSTGVGEKSGKQTGLEDTKEIQAENLTDNLGVSICIDYMIKSYETVQTFSYEFMKYNLEEENPVLSPVSAYLALGMAASGAKGDTLTEFQDLLGYDLACIPNSLMNQLPREQAGMNILLANSAWVDEDLEPQEDYLVAIDSYFQSQVYQTDLDTMQAMKDINTWVDTNTNGLIPKLLEEPLSEYARLALLNTVYFKGDWKRPFEVRSTRELEFTTESGEIINVDMMQKYSEEQLYIKSDIAEGIILPYRDETVSFVALKPIGDSTVREMYEQLTWHDISNLLMQEERTLCNLQLPKFEISFSKRLNDSLQEMGLQKAFDAEVANLSGMGTTKSGYNLYISLVYQEAVIRVDEEGTEAAAATMADICDGTTMEIEKPVDVFFNEPFLYMIVDTELEVPLFIGIMDNPNK